MMALVGEKGLHLTVTGYLCVMGCFYPGWTPRPESPLLALASQVYQRQHGAKPKVKVIHAGLECGILLGKYPDLDIISFGPDIRGAHSPSERVNVASVARFWDFLCELLAQIPARRLD